MNRPFWAGKRVLVTGHTGFKGSWLCAWLVDAGASVTGYALKPASPSLFSASGVATAVRSEIGDIRDRDRLGAVVASCRPEIAFHLAAQPLVRESYRRPAETIDVNAGGTALLLDVLRGAADARAAVIVTSDKCYAHVSRTHRHVETDRLGGRDPYSASKACAELIAAAYRDSFFAGGMGLATARAGNVVGGGDFAEDRLLPDLVRAFTAGRPALIRRPDAIRPWQHVLDPLAGYLALAQALYGEPARFAGAWNFGPPPNHERPVGEVAELAVHAWGGDASWETDDSEHPPESDSLRLDSEKAERELGWRARIGLESAITATIAWHQAFDDRASARALLRADIERFEAAPV